jgi:hypothetical protein
MRRVLVVLLGVGMATPSGAADRPRPPGPAAVPLITDHEFEPWEYSSGLVVCQYWDQRRLRMCDRPESEHGPRVEETAQADS